MPIYIFPIHVIVTRVRPTHHMPIHILPIHLIVTRVRPTQVTRAYLRGGGLGGSNPPPPPKFSDFFLKSEGKEIERKRKKRGGVTS